MWEAAVTWGLVVVAAAAGWVLFASIYRSFIRFHNSHVTVYDYERGVKIRAGRAVGELGPGRYPTWPAPVEITRIDLRQRSVTVPGQEMLTADKLSVRVSLILSWRVKDTNAFRAVHEDATGRIYEVAQLVLRNRIASLSLDDVAGDRGALEEGLAQAIATPLADLGVEVLAVAAKDILLVGPAKQAYADLWRAQKEGLAALERARGEHAALRSLANAARLLKGNPELMNLRILAALQGRPGQPAASVILGGAPGLVPVSPGTAETSLAPAEPDA